MTAYPTSLRASIRTSEFDAAADEVESTLDTQLAQATAPAPSSPPAATAQPAGIRLPSWDELSGGIGNAVGGVVNTVTSKAQSLQLPSLEDFLGSDSTSGPAPSAGGFPPSVSTGRSVNNALTLPSLDEFLGSDATSSQSAPTAPQRAFAPADGDGGIEVQIDRSSPDAFLQSFVPAAQTALRAKGLPTTLAPILAAIPMNEQGWQREAPGNNYYGIKGSNPRTGANTGPVGTWEDYGQGRQNISDTFRAYSNPTESVQDFLQFLEDNPRYGNALKVARETGDPEAFIRAVHQAGYATDPAWSDKVLSIARRVAPSNANEQQLGSPMSDSALPIGTQDPEKADVLSVARGELGKRYAGPIVGEADAARWGTPGWDCSSFVSGVLRKFGVNLTPFTDAAARETQRINPDQARPGDIVLFRYNDPSQPGVAFPHMAIYAGNGRIIDASYGRGVTERDMPTGLGEAVFHRAPGIDAGESRGVVATADTINDNSYANAGGVSQPAQPDEGIGGIVSRGSKQLSTLLNQGAQAVGDMLAPTPQPTPDPINDNSYGNAGGVSRPVEKSPLEKIGNAGRGAVTGVGNALGNLGQALTVEATDEQTATPQYRHATDFPDEPLYGPVQPSSTMAEVGPRLQAAVQRGIDRAMSEQDNPFGKSLPDKYYTPGLSDVNDKLRQANRGLYARTNAVPFILQEIGKELGIGTAELPGIGEAGPTDLMGLPGRVGDVLGSGGARALRRATSRGAAELENAAARGLVSEAPNITERGISAVADTVRDLSRSGLRFPKSGIVDEATDRFYHGTGSAFDRPDPGRFDENGLFGPGYYVTSEPRVAGSGNFINPGYAEQRGRAVRQPVDPYTELALKHETEALARVQKQLEFSRVERDAERTAKLEEAVARRQARVDELQQKINDHITQPGPNVRPVDVPRDLKFFDVDATASPDDLARIYATASGGDYARELELWRGQPPMSGMEAYKGLGRDKAEANRILAAAGFDGIRYDGGKRIPMQGDDGSPIEHTAIVVFPESLDKIKNALSGTPGGFVEGAASRLGQRMGTGALQGGVAGGYQASQEEGATPASIATGALQGAGTGALRGAIGARPGATAGAIARAVPDVGHLYDEAPKASPTESIGTKLEGIRREFVRAWTDNKVDLSEFQNKAARALGRALKPEEMAYELSRLNPDRAAEMRIQEHLRPAIQAVGENRGLLSEYLTYLQNVDVAKAMGNPNRKFSFGLTAQESADRLDQIRQMPQFKQIDEAAQQVKTLVDGYRQRMLDSGVWSQELFDELSRRYPNYTPTRITDYLRDPARVPVGKSLNLRDRGLRTLSEEGTERAREDPLASLIRYAYDAEAIIRKNETFNAFVKLRDADPDLQAMIRPVPSSYTPTSAEAVVTGFVDGVRQTYAVPKAMESVVKAEPGAVIPGIAGTVWSGLMNLFRMGTTSRNPTFLAANALLDAATFGIRESVREGGPQALPKVLVELGKAYADTFRGLPSGTYHGDTTRFLREGGGMFGFFNRNETGARRELDDLTRKSMVDIRSAGDLKRLMGWLLSLKPVEVVGERIELAPRVASMRLAERRGADQVRAVINGRTVTMDFAQGGDLAKVINQFVPFFNVGVQGSVAAHRAFRENPKAFVATAAALLAGPTLAAEAWNRSDPQRAKDYEDVPQYLKDQGIVIMLPNASPRDDRGERRPQFVHLRLREYAPIAIMTREAASRALGGEPREWSDLIGNGLASIAPIQGNSPADLLSSFTPLGVSTGLQLATNQDFFRGRTIASEGADERASALSKGIAGVTGARPSQVEFSARDLGGGVAGAVLAASDLATGNAKVDERPQSLPGAGGLVGRFVKDATGERLEKARNQGLSLEARKVIKAADIQYEPAQVRNEIDGIPLVRDEQAKYQQLVNKYASEGIARLGTARSWSRLTKDDKEAEIKAIVDEARARAADEVLSGISAAEEKRRLGLKRAS